jgi:GxxExxY protein
MENMQRRFEPDEELDAFAYGVIGAAIEVHRHLGPGYIEGVYEEVLAVEFQMKGIPYEKQKPIELLYKGRPVGEGRLDFLIGGLLIVELKAVEELAPIHKAQLLSYLRITNRHLGLLINFNEVVLKDGIQRVIRS